MALHKSGEDYLETILILSRTNSYVRSIDIATEMGFSKASVSRAVGLLKNEGLITIEDDGQILLTKEGTKKAVSVYSRHNILTDFFSNYLGVDPKIAEQDACKVEHVISEETFEKLKIFMKK